jgi:sugar fermentation stimulation protein A
LENGEGRACYVELKNVTAVDEQGTAIFPDAVSARASRHLEALAELVAKGHRAVIFFCVQRGDARRLAPADVIDPIYGRTLRRVLAQGVEALAWRADVSQRAIVLETPLPVVC